MITLTPPKLNPENIDQTIVCIRPKRLGGARIEREHLDKKLIIHNYGHGGFGWTLLPGSVLKSLTLLQEAIALNPLLAEQKITVLGAGCMGLLTAIFLHERGYDVTVVAEHIEQLTSHKAAGSFSAIAIKASKDNQACMDQAAVDSYIFYKELATALSPTFTGVTQIPAYMVHDGNPTYHYPIIAAGVMPAWDEVTINFGNGAEYKAKKFDTFALDTNHLMQQFMDKVLSYNIPVIRKKITDFSHLVTSIIFNCSGLGSRVHEPKAVMPVQGHLIKVRDQPDSSLDYMIYAHVKIEGRLREVTWSPKAGGMLGACVINGEELLDVNAQQANAMLKWARIFFTGAQFLPAPLPGRLD